jgi:hypothetical protein
MAGFEPNGMQGAQVSAPARKGAEPLLEALSAERA